MVVRIGRLALIAALLALVGCSGSESSVSGTVLVDGQPLKEGDIIFEPADGNGTPAAGKIVDGKYTIKIAPGMKKVRINASRPARKVDPVMGAAARESMIAKEFNEQSTLTADIKSSKQDGVNFEVKSIP
ncbi:MAG TPA: hypothetical protein VHR66_05250 [Gemmataceae bacterium]|jgi:hypothetical protein|nr:hypothetical protein [Gemmataceae bacterium]